MIKFFKRLYHKIRKKIMKDDDIEGEEAAAWDEYLYSEGDYLLHEGANLTKEDIEEHERIFRSIMMPEDMPYQSPYCEKCGGNTISLFLHGGKKIFIRCMNCKHNVSKHT
jgi:hypothetical protein